MLTLYIGTQADPAEREQVQISPEDMRAVDRLRNTYGEAVLVTNQETGERILLEAADCGLQCRCAVVRTTTSRICFHRAQGELRDARMWREHGRRGKAVRALARANSERRRGLWHRSVGQ